MFQKVSGDLSNHLKKCATAGVEVNFSELFDQFTTSLILQTIYGVESNNLIGHPENRLCQIGPSIMNKTKWEIVKDLFLIAFPNLSRRLRLKFFRKELQEFFLNLSRETSELHGTETSRSDFMALLMGLGKNGDGNDETSIGQLTFNEITAQAFIFFFGGFETSSKTLGFLIYELALNQEIQNRTREEVQRVYRENNQEFTYDSLKELAYLDRVIDGEKCSD